MYPATGRGGPMGSGKIKVPDLLDFRQPRVVGRQSNAPAAFTPEEIPGTHFQKLSRPQGTWFCRKEPRKKSQVTPLVIEPGTVRLVAQCLNHYATSGPIQQQILLQIYVKPMLQINLLSQMLTLLEWRSNTTRTLVL